MRTFRPNLASTAIIIVAALSCATALTGKGRSSEPEERSFEGRPYELFVPETATRPAPAVLVLHGSTGSGAGVRKETNFDLWAEKYGVVAIYPNGVSGWNDGRNSREAIKSDADDVSYLLDLVEDLAADGLIDQNAVYAIGMSNGGGMAMRLACERGDRISGIGVVTTKEVYGLECDGHRPIPTTFFLGTEDRLLRHEGDPTGKEGLSRRSVGSAYSADETISRWRERNRCAIEPFTSFIDQSKEDEISIDRFEYQDCAAPLVYYEIHGGGHTWPSPMTRYRSVARLVRGRTARDLDASEETLRIWLGEPGL